MAKKTKTQEELINEIRTACAALGWFIGMDETNDFVTGLVIGQEHYVESVLEDLQDGDHYAIYDTNATDVGLQ